jgi:Raf kinase inhibitor-like YbhB/YbcL family protein
MEKTMHRIQLFFCTVLASAALLAAEPPATAAPFRLSSPDLVPGQTINLRQVFNGFGCTGSNVSPALSWSNVPAGTKSFALMMYDPDAPTGSGWWHWVVWNLPGNLRALPAGAGAPAAALMPPGAQQGNTDFGVPGYGGPYHYAIRLHALKVEKLDLPATATAAFVGFNVNANTIARAELHGIYRR